MIKYAIITPAYNEEEHLPRLIESVLGQTERPVVWVIVDDGSSDRTAEIIDAAANRYSFIKAIHLSRDTSIAYYAHKIHAFNQGYKLLCEINDDYEVLGNLDADLSLYPKFYENVLLEYEQDSTLGVAGGSYRYADDGEVVVWGGSFVPGSMLTCRKKCFEEVGGYRILKYGAEDTLMCLMAEMKGWRVGYFPQYQVVQHRLVGSTGGVGALKAKVRQGKSDKIIGYHPFFFLLKFFKRCFVEKPYILAGSARLVGYLSGFVFREKDIVEEEVVKFIRKKQMHDLFSHKRN